MANKMVNEYSAATTIDGAADYLLIDPVGTGAYKKITRNVLTGLTSAPLGLTDTQSPTNKTFDNTNALTIKDSNLTIQDNSDTAKQAKFELSSITTANTRTITLPDSNTTIPIASYPITIAGPTAARTYTFPDAATTIAGIATAQSLTNKTISGSTNILGAITMTLGSDADGDIYYRSSNVLTRLAKGTASQVLTMNTKATAPEWAAGSNYLTLLKANSSTEASAGATNVDTYAISGLTAKDTIVIEYNVNTVTANTAAGSIYHVTDSTPLINTSALTAGGTAGEFATVKIGQAQNDATVYQATIYGLAPVSLGSGGTTAATVSSYQDLTTSFQGSWTIALRHGGVTATGSYRWSWAVYKLAGQ